VLKNKSEKVLFKDIIKACTFKKVIEALTRLYPDQKKLLKGYKHVFETLTSMRPRYNKEGMVIDITKVGRGKNAYFSVDGVCMEKEGRQSYAIEYMAWSKWLGMEVAQKVLQNIPKEDIAAHCIWEMTFMGFTQDRIRRQLNALKKRVRDVKEGKVKTIPYEEVIARLEERIKKERK